MAYQQFMRNGKRIVVLCSMVILAASVIFAAEQYAILFIRAIIEHVISLLAELKFILLLCHSFNSSPPTATI